MCCLPKHLLYVGYKLLVDIETPIISRFFQKLLCTQLYLSIMHVSVLVSPDCPTFLVSHYKVMYFIEVLVKTLGSEPAWQELWSKLHTTLSQIK